MAVATRSGWAAATGVLTALFGVRRPGCGRDDHVEDCAEEKRLAASLAAHAAGVAYPAQKAELERVAGETAEHAEELAGLVRLRGLEPPEAQAPARPTEYPDMVRGIQEDVLALKRRIARYQDLLTGAPDDVKRVIRRIYESKLEHLRALVAVVVRVVR